MFTDDDIADVVFDGFLNGCLITLQPAKLLGDGIVNASWMQLMEWGSVVWMQDVRWPFSGE